ncbi:hypothetical protein, partial [Streptomyces diastaticus]|uniref:hypothetical protein n=1 Tax=Streptomyces diastaticus TaxID=1956 RepID=UPI00344A7176
GSLGRKPIYQGLHHLVSPTEVLQQQVGKGSLEDEERRLAQQFLEGLTWIDHHEAEERRRWDEQREQQLSAHGSDIGSYESSWVHTGPLPPFGEVDQAVQKWTSARAALEERLRKALQGM